MQLRQKGITVIISDQDLFYLKPPAMKPGTTKPLDSFHWKNGFLVLSFKGHLAVLGVGIKFF